MTITETFPGYVTGTWTNDPPHSEITFTVKHLAISKVRGSFKEFSATLVTAEDPAESTVSASIQVASVDTRMEIRDNQLRSGDFFLADEFPTMDFVSTGFTNSGSDITITGNLTLRGVTKEVTLAGEFGGIASAYGQTRMGVSATTKISRKDFGMTFNMPLEGGGLTIGDEITIGIDLQFVLQDA